MIRWVVAVVAVAALVGAAALALAPDGGHPVATMGHTGVPLQAPTTTAAPPVAPTTTTTARRTVVTSRSSTVVTSPSGAITIVNEGSASVDTGGNTGGTVVTGPATAVGNVSRP